MASLLRASGKLRPRYDITDWLNAREKHPTVSQAFWHFHGPECGFGDSEHGYLLTAQEIHCIVCMEEEGREVRLHRWEMIEIDKLAA
jgi:hypothetical protein